MATLVISISIIILILILYYFRIYIQKHFKKKDTFNPKNLLKLEIPIVLIGIVIAIEIVLNKIIQTEMQINTTISSINTTLLIIAFTYALMISGEVMLHKWSQRLKKLHDYQSHEEILPILKSIKNIVLFVVGSLFILKTWGINIGTILASLGVIGVMLTVVYKETISNVFSGISIIMDENFIKGDLIELSNGEIGYVEEITLRSTKIRNFNLEEVIVPNALLANMEIKNYAHPTKSIRLKIPFSVKYGTPHEKVEQLVLNLLKSKDDLLRYPAPKVFFENMGDYSLQFIALAYIKDYRDMYSKKSKLVGEIYNLLNKNKIQIPFPTRTIKYEK